MGTASARCAALLVSAVPGLGCVLLPGWGAVRFTSQLMKNDFFSNNANTYLALNYHEGAPRADPVSVRRRFKHACLSAPSHSTCPARSRLRIYRARLYTSAQKAEAHWRKPAPWHGPPPSADTARLTRAFPAMSACAEPRSSSSRRPPSQTEGTPPGTPARGGAAENQPTHR